MHGSVTSAMQGGSLPFEKYIEITGIVAVGLLAAFGIVFANRKSDLQHQNAKAARWPSIKAASADLTFIGWLLFFGGLIGASYAAISTWRSATELRESKRRELILQLKGIELKPRITVLFHLKHPLTTSVDAQAAEKKTILEAYSTVKYPSISGLWLRENCAKGSFQVRPGLHPIPL